MYPVLILALALTPGAPKGKDLPKPEPTIVGDWVGTKVRAGGKEMPVPDAGLVFSFGADGTVVVTDGGRSKPEGGSYKLDPKKDPAEIDLTPSAIKNEPTMLGIYKLDGETLTLCFRHGPPGAARPTKFESPDGSDLLLLTLKRQKKD